MRIPFAVLCAALVCCFAASSRQLRHQSLETSHHTAATVTSSPETTTTDAKDAKDAKEDIDDAAVPLMQELKTCQKVKPQLDEECFREQMRNLGGSSEDESQLAGAVAKAAELCMKAKKVYLFRSGHTALVQETSADNPTPNYYIKTAEKLISLADVAVKGIQADRQGLETFKSCPDIYLRRGEHLKSAVRMDDQRLGIVVRHVKQREQRDADQAILGFAGYKDHRVRVLGLMVRSHFS